VNVENKEQSKQWMHTHSPKMPKNLNKRCLPASKLMTTVFWDRKGVLMMKFMQRGTTVTSEVYCKTLKQLPRAIQNKRRGMLTCGTVQLRDNARPHTTTHTRELLEHFKWELFDRHSYSPDLAQSDGHLFIYLKNWPKSQRFYSYNKEDMMEGVKTWLSSQVADLFDKGITRLIPQYDECLGWTIGFRFPAEVKRFSTASRPALWHTQPPIEWDEVTFPKAGKRPGREADN
jgi:histone-lysine N-methyltransferase SETMAR